VEKLMDRKDKIKVCLDEIEAAYVIMGKSRTKKQACSKCRGWIKRQKDILKELKYRGKIPRKKRVS
jgi:hypothetical protein